MNKYEKILSLNLEHKQKITIVKRNESGNIEVLQKRFLSVEPYIPYEGVSEAFIGATLTLDHTRTRKEYPPRIDTIQHFQEFIIYDGWVDMDINDIIYEIRPTQKKQPIRFLKYPNYQPFAFLDIAEAYPDFLLSDI